MKQSLNTTNYTPVFSSADNSNSRTMVIGVGNTSPEPGVEKISQVKKSVSVYDELKIPFSSEIKFINYLKNYNIHVSMAWKTRYFFTSDSKRCQADSSTSNGKISRFSPYFVQQIFRFANWWMPYLSSDSYDKLVLHIIESVCTIQTAVIGTYPSQNSYVLNIEGVRRNTNPLPKEVSMLIKTNGKIYYSSGKGDPVHKLS